MKSVLFVYNPYSGENYILMHLDHIIAEYQKAGCHIIPFRFVLESPMEELLELMKGEHRHILIAGGDGTVNLLVNMLLSNGIETPIAVLPSGTANDFAKLMGHTGNIKEACARILNGKVDEVDVGKVNDTYFVNVLSAGLFTTVSQNTPTVLKNTFGKLAYYVNSLGELPRFKMMKLKMEAEEGHEYKDEAVIFFVFNGRTAGNLKIAHYADEKDGLLDVVVIKNTNPIDGMKVVLHFLTNPIVKSSYPNGVYHFKTRELTIESERDFDIDIDGEAGPQLPLKISCLHRALKVIR